MLFRNDDPGPVSEADLDRMHECLRLFHTTDEVRFHEDVRILAPILNTLTVTGTKFYLIHLPAKRGWVLRKFRPTGVPSGKPVPADDAAQPVGSEPQPPASEADPGPGDASPPHQVDDRVTAEEYFGDCDPDGVRHAAPDPSAAPQSH